MDVEKLIERLNKLYQSLRLDGEQQCSPEINTVAFGLMDAATALSTLQAENEKLLDKIEDARLEGYAKGLGEMSEENEKLRAELEQVKQEMDAAQSLLAERIGVRGAEPITTAFGLPLDRLRKLAQADRKGRCIVLPCKKGDTVWRIVHDAAPHIAKDRCTDIKYENRDIWVHLIGDRVMGGWNFGKLLFLTREEAEDALRREQDG